MPLHDITTELLRTIKALRQYVTVINDGPLSESENDPIRWDIIVQASGMLHLTLRLIELSFQQWSVRIIRSEPGKESLIKIWIFEPYVSKPDYGPIAYCPKCLLQTCNMAECSHSIPAEMIGLEGCYKVFVQSLLEEIKAFNNCK